MSEKQEIQAGMYSLMKNLIIELSSADPEKNIAFSPFSIYAALALAQLGSKNETLKELSQFLQMSENTLDSHEHLGKIMEGFQGGEEVKVFVANGLFINAKYKARGPYLENAKKYYKGELMTLDFSTGAEEPTKIVNQWVSDKTNGNIEEIFAKPLDADIALLLASAIHFKAKWMNVFDESSTTKQPFKGMKGTIEVEMMNKTNRVFYHKNTALKFQSIAIPYADNDYKYLVILPDEGVNVETLFSSINHDILKEMADSKERTNVHYGIPKHKVGSSLSLKEALQKLGVKIAFGEKADFGDIGEGLTIGDVVHKCQVEVMETGTVASAATVVKMMLRSMGMREEPPVEFVVDRPFIFYIHNKECDAFLFSGIIHKPVY